MRGVADNVNNPRKRDRRLHDSISCFMKVIEAREVLCVRFS